MKLQKHINKVNIREKISDSKFPKFPRQFCIEKEVLYIT